MEIDKLETEVDKILDAVESPKIVLNTHNKASDQSSKDKADEMKVFLMQTIPREYFEDLSIQCLPSAKGGFVAKVDIKTKSARFLIGRNGWILRLIVELLEEKFKPYQVSISLKRTKVKSKLVVEGVEL